MKKKSVDTEVVGLIDKMQQQLTALEGKIDVLISRSSQKPAEPRPVHKPFQQHPQQHSSSGGNIQRSHGNNFNQRVLHKAVCADCKKECEVPFRPTGDRPVYCKECFSKRKTGGGSFKARPDSRPGVVASAQAVHMNKAEPVLKKKSLEKKKPAAKKKKARTTHSGK